MSDIGAPSPPAVVAPVGFDEAAPAKINLYLHVLGRRPDGYHELDSLVAFADVGDRLTVRPADALAFGVDGPFAAALSGEPPSSNLVVRAAEALAGVLGRPAAVALHLTKQLPVASGIGGGSADAAACLRALARLWGLSQGDERLRVIAARLGADVPVCLDGRAAYFGGIGDRLDPAPDLPSCPVVLVNPGVALATPAVFKARTGGFSPPARLVDRARDVAMLARMLAARTNDLAPAAIGLVPAITRVLAALDAQEGCLLARLSGSGATCFGLFEHPEQAQRAASAIAAAEPGWWARAGTLNA